MSFTEHFIQSTFDLHSFSRNTFVDTTKGDVNPSGSNIDNTASKTFPLVHSFDSSLIVEKVKMSPSDIPVDTTCFLINVF